MPRFPRIPKKWSLAIAMPARALKAHPSAWLMAAAKYRAIDYFRRGAMLERKHEKLGRDDHDACGQRKFLSLPARCYFEGRPVRPSVIACPGEIRFDTIETALNIRCPHGFESRS